MQCFFPDDNAARDAWRKHGPTTKRDDYLAILIKEI